MAVQPVEHAEFVRLADLRSERLAILGRLGMDEHELLSRGEAWTLDTEEQWQAFDRLKGIRFLLGEDD